MSDSAKRVLVVDDDPDILLVLVSLLEDAGYEVSTAEQRDDLAQLSRLGEGELPDLIVLDLYLSGKDSSQAARHLKAHETTRRIPILMLSAHPDAAREAKDAGADGFLPKPFDLDMLLKTIGAFFV